MWASYLLTFVYCNKLKRKPVVHALPGRSGSPSVLIVAARQLDKIPSVNTSAVPSVKWVTDGLQIAAIASAPGPDSLSVDGYPEIIAKYSNPRTWAAQRGRNGKQVAINAIAQKMGIPPVLSMSANLLTK